jgi:hypothetical protein
MTTERIRLGNEILLLEPDDYPVANIPYPEFHSCLQRGSTQALLSRYKFLILVIDLIRSDMDVFSTVLKDSSGHYVSMRSDMTFFEHLNNLMNEDMNMRWRSGPRHMSVTIKKFQGYLFYLGLIFIAKHHVPPELKAIKSDYQFLFRVYPKHNVLQDVTILYDLIPGLFDFHVLLHETHSARIGLLKSLSHYVEIDLTPLSPPSESIEVAMEMPRNERIRKIVSQLLIFYPDLEQCVGGADVLSNIVDTLEVIRTFVDDVAE